MVSKEIDLKSLEDFKSIIAVFCQKATSFKSRVWIEKDDRNANAKSVLGLLSLGISKGTKIVINAEGEDEEKALDELSLFFK